MIQADHPAIVIRTATVPASSPAPTMNKPVAAPRTPYLRDWPPVESLDAAALIFHASLQHVKST